MYSNISARVGKMLYPQNKLQDMEMEDQDYKKDQMTTVTSEEFRWDYFNRPRVNVEGKGHRLQSKHRTKIKNEIEKKIIQEYSAKHSFTIYHYLQRPQLYSILVVLWNAVRGSVFAIQK